MTQALGELRKLDEHYEYMAKRLEQEDKYNPVSFLGVRASLQSLRVIYSLIAVWISTMASREIRIEIL